MLIVIGKAACDPAKRDEVIELMRWMQTESRQEPGCIDYGFHESVEQANEFIAVELWESKEALRTHFGAPSVAGFGARLGPLVSRAPEVEIHHVERTTAFPDLD
jgi:quinol monooxygenase YgiN